jgi:hypothetical protein
MFVLLALLMVRFLRGLDVVLKVAAGMLPSLQTLQEQPRHLCGWHREDPVSLSADAAYFKIFIRTGQCAIGAVGLVITALRR